MVLVICFIFIKVINLINNPILREFPLECEPENGCARIMISGDHHRSSQVNFTNLFTINHLGVNNTNDIIRSCVDKQSQSRIEYTGTTSTSPSFFHVNFASIFWGFVDDMTIEVIPCVTFGEADSLHPGEEHMMKDNIQPALAIQVQSQLRLGKSDFGVNPYRIANFYK